GHTSQWLAGGLGARDRGVWPGEYRTCRRTPARLTTWPGYRTRAGRHERSRPTTWYSIRRITRHWTTRFSCAGWSGHGVLSCDSRNSRKLFLASSSAGEYAGLEWTFHGPAKGCIVRLHTNSRVGHTVSRAVARYDALCL